MMGSSHWRPQKSVLQYVFFRVSGHNIQLRWPGLEEFGRNDIRSAGRGGAQSPRALVQMPVAEWDEIVDTNLGGAFLSNNAVLPAMIRQRSGTIFNVSPARGAM